MIARVASLALILVASIAVPVSAQRDYPAEAMIRGDNVWLRVDPAEDTEIVAYLQRGDQIRVTDDATEADGDAFYPIEVVETGESGWVRELFIDPRSFASVTTVSDLVIAEPATDQGANTPKDKPKTRQGTKTPKDKPATNQGVSKSIRKSRTKALQALADAGELDCQDFSSQAEAQAFFDAQGWSATNDPYQLDQGGEPDVPCESLS